MGISWTLFQQAEYPKIYLFYYTEPLEYESCFDDQLHTKQLIHTTEVLLEELTHKQALCFRYIPKLNQFHVYIVQLWQIKNIGIELELNQILTLAQHLRLNDARNVESIDPFMGDY